MGWGGMVCESHPVTRPSELYSGRKLQRQSKTWPAEESHPESGDCPRRGFWPPLALFPFSSQQQPKGAVGTLVAL